MTETDQDEEEKKRRRYIVLALLVLLLLLLCLGGVLYWLFAIRPSDDPDPDPSATSSTAVTTTETTPATETSTTTSAPTTTTTTTAPPATIAIPSVVGQTVGQATDILEQAGFTNIKVVLGTETGQDVTGNSQYDGNEVIGVNPAQGTSVVGSTQIILVAKSTTGIGSG